MKQIQSQFPKRIQKLKNDFQQKPRFRRGFLFLFLKSIFPNVFPSAEFFPQREKNLFRL